MAGLAAVSIRSRMILSRSRVYLFDHLVGAAEQWQRERETKSFRGLEVQHQLDFTRLLYGEVCRPRSLEDKCDVDADLIICMSKIDAVTHQAAVYGHFTHGIDGWHGMASCERDDLDVAVEKERIGNDNESSGLMLDKVAKAASMSVSLLATRT